MHSSLSLSHIYIYIYIHILYDKVLIEVILSGFKNMSMDQLSSNFLILLEFLKWILLSEEGVSESGSCSRGPYAVVRV